VVGVGPRLNLPFGPLRVDFSWSLRPEPGKGRVLGAQFAIGPTF
jgi:outer membrane protein assembly factor BamA